MSNGFTERQCPHDRCLNHNPNFGNSTEEKADFKPSWVFKILTFFENFCCKKEMKIQQVTSVQQCKACSRKKLFNYGYYEALCECCGYHYKFRLSGGKMALMSLIGAIISGLSLLAGLVLAFTVSNSSQSVFIVSDVFISVVMTAVFGLIFSIKYTYRSERMCKE